MAITTLFKSIDEVQDYISIDISHDIDTVLPYIKQAEKFTKEIIGAALHNSLVTFVNEDGTDEHLENLLPYVQLPLINFAYMLGTPKMNVNIGDTGITITDGNNLQPADEWRVKDLIKSFASAGYDGLEDLLEFLEDNKDSYSSWESSSAYSYNKQFFVNNAKELNDSIFIDIKRRDFLKVKPFIHQIERSVVLPVMCSVLFNLIKTQYKEDTLTDPNTLLLNTYIRPAVCYLALDKYKENENYRLEGKRYLEELKLYLDANASTYTDYAESDCYTDPDDYEELNDEDSSLYIFGRPA